MLLAFAILPQPGFVPPSPPAEKATTSQDQTRQASTGDGAGDARPARLRYLKQSVSKSERFSFFFLLSSNDEHPPKSQNLS
jgi:hypothetical protein